MLSPRRIKVPVRAAALAAAALAVAGVLAAVNAAGGLHSTSHGSSAAHVLTRPAADRADRSIRAMDVSAAWRLARPDVLVVLHHAAKPARVDRLRHAPGVHAVGVLSRGIVRVRGARLHLIGGPVADVRGFTPQLTARSDPLWRSVARGELTISYSAARQFRRLLGATLPVRGGYGFFPVRVGAFASLGLGGADGLVAPEQAVSLGLRPDRELVVSARHVDLDVLRNRIHRLFGARARVVSLRPKPVDQSMLSDYARATIPASYLTLYRSAATTCVGLPWTVLAAIGAVETGHGADTRISSKGAVGPMQFLPSTFAAYAVDGDRDGVADIHDPSDAVYTASRYLCLWGAGRGGQALYDAVFAYNHADWYVRQVFALANAYA